MRSRAWAPPRRRNPTPTCAEGPTRDGEVIVGTPCDDHIVVPATVTYVDGGPGDDVIEGTRTTPASSSFVTCQVEVECHLEVGSQTFEGGPGDDIVYGERGDDVLRGNGGDDRLYGGIGDDRLDGGPGNDWLSGGFGSDTIDGGEGDDFVRGDGTVDHISDTGGGYDTLSFATGITPGFGRGKAPDIPGFPKTLEGERGVIVDLAEGGENANNGLAESGGGVDEVQPGDFERIIGSPFSDYIVGSGASEEILGGGGADVIIGGGGTDVLRGGADGDYLEAGSGSRMYGESGGPGGTEPAKDKVDYCTGGGEAIGCGASTAAVVARPEDHVSVGETDAGSGSTDIYLIGSAAADDVTAHAGASAVEFTLAAGSEFNLTEADSGGCTVTATQAVCPLATPAAPNVPPLDAVLIAGMAGDDTISAPDFPRGSTVIAIGGAGADHINTGPSEDVLVDGPPDETAADTMHAEANDDALLHNGGADLLDGGEGSDLFLSVSICDGETIDGGTKSGEDRDNSSWSKLDKAVDARLDLGGEVGEVGPGEAPVCASGTFDHLVGIDDLEGTNYDDVLYGDEGANQLLGHRGSDTYHAMGDNDVILANSGTVDNVIDCGEGTEDKALIDLPPVIDPTPIDCEQVREAAPGEYSTQVTEPLPVPLTPAPATTVTPAPDRTPPQTRLLKHPKAAILLARGRPATVTFRFGAGQPATFECKLDARPYRRCTSPLRLKVGLGRHIFRVFATDAAGNRDLTAAKFRFRVAVRRHRTPPHSR